MLELLMVWGRPTERSARGLTGGSARVNLGPAQHSRELPPGNAEPRPGVRPVNAIVIGRHRIRAAVAVLGLVLLLPGVAPADAAGPPAQRLALGSTDDTVTTALASTLAAALDAGGLPDTAVRAVTAADSLHLVEDLRSGRVDLALVRADALAQAAGGRGAFAGAPAAERLRSIAHLGRLPLHLAVPADSAADGPADLAGRSVAVTPPGAARLGLVRAVLANANGGAPAARLQPADLASALDRIAAGSDAALAIVAAAPVTGLAQAVRRGALRLLPVPGPTVRRLGRDRPGVGPAAVPGPPYGLAADTPSVGVGLVLAVREDLDDPTAYRVAETLWSPALSAQLADSAATRGRLRLGRALTDLPVPLHAGAISWYQRRGLLP